MNNETSFELERELVVAREDTAPVRTQETPAAVTLDEVRSAISKPQVTGEKITVARIREEVGHGSMTTILKFVRQVRAESTSVSAAPPSELIAEAGSSIQGLLAKLWAAAVSKAGAE